MNNNDHWLKINQEHYIISLFHLIDTYYDAGASEIHVVEQSLINFNHSISSYSMLIAGGLG